MSLGKFFIYFILLFAFLFSYDGMQSPMQFSIGVNYFDNQYNQYNIWLIFILFLWIFL